MAKFYTSSQVGKLLGVCTESIDAWINAKKLNAFKTVGGHNRIRLEDILEFLQKNNIPVPPELDTASRPRVLIVEDDEDVRDFVVSVINNLEYTVDVEIAPSGYAAGSKIATFKPDIVVLDIMLPGINGIEICKQIRRELGEEVKILAVTGYFSEENRRKILEAGADTFMRKPMFLDELTRTLKKFIESYKYKYHLQIKPSQPTSQELKEKQEPKEPEQE